MKLQMAKRIIQGIALIGGVYGVMLLYFSLSFLIDGIKKSEPFLRVFMAPLFLGMGAILTVIAYRALFRFSDKSISHVSGAIGFMVYALCSNQLRPYLENLMDKDKSIGRMIAGFAPILVGVLAHKLLKRIFTYWVNKQEIQPPLSPSE
ncbi:MAG: hypothetical protein OES84_02295 [Kiritimatiellaceae bacterium]|nr:hypothetical protein [Kiritimatiellaceae bacterium]